MADSPRIANQSERAILYNHLRIYTNTGYYMALFQKDWKQTNSRIWLAKILTVD